MGREVRMNRHELRLFSAMAVAIIVMALALLLLLLVPGAMGGTIVGDQPPASGDWVITQDTVVTDHVVTVRGSVVIKAELTLKGSSLLIEGLPDGSVGINVTSGGRLAVNDSSIVSSNGRPYFFRVYDEMDLTRVTVRNVLDGVLVSTSEEVTIDRVRFLDFNGPGLVLEGASGTTVKDVAFQSDGYVTRHSASVSTNSSVRYAEWDYDHPGIIDIRGGSPTIDGVDISINGTFVLDLAYSRSNIMGGLGLDLGWAMMHVDSKGTVDIRDVVLRDSTVYHSVNLGVTGSTSTNFDLDIDHGIDMVVFRDYRDASVIGIDVGTITNYMPQLSIAGIDPSSVQVTYIDGGIRGVHAFVSETFTTRGPHIFDLVVKDMDVARSPILYHHLDLSYKGATSPTFDSSVLVDNVSATLAELPLVFEVRPTFTLLKTVRLDVTVSNSTFHQLGSSAITVDYHPGPPIPDRRVIELHATTTINDCVFTNSNAGNHGLVNVPVRFLEPNTDLDNNTFIIRNSTFSQNIGTLLNINGSVTLGRDRLLIDNNMFDNNTAWMRQRTLFISGRTVLIFTNNSFNDNNCSAGILIQEAGASSIASNPCSLTIANNSFIGNWDNPFERSPGVIIDVYWGGELIVRDNLIAESGVIFLNLTETPALSGGSTLDFHHNRVLRNRNPVLFFNNNDRYHMQLEATIRDNTVWDNKGPLVDYNLDTPLVLVYDFDATFYLLDNDVRRAGSTVFKNYGNITVKGNTFTECVGWVLVLENLEQQRPYLANNTFLRCGNAIYIGTKPSAPSETLMWMDNNNIDSNGTAIYLHFMKVTMRTTTITSGTGKAVIADISKVDAYDCDFDADACEVIVDGYIKMWYWVEAWVFWASKEGVGTSNPVVGGSVTFFDQYDVESLVVLPDDTGHVVPTEVMAWHIIHSVSPVMKSPYTITVNFSSFSTSTELSIDRSYKGEDALTLLLWDPEDPLVSIERPEHMSAHNTLDLEVTGFATDRASGVHLLTVQVDDGVRHNVTDIEEDGSYYHLLLEVPEGLHVLTVTLYDAGLNLMVVTVTVEVDRTPPRLVVTHPSGELHTNLTEVNIRGEVEPGSNLTVNMYEYANPGGVFDLFFNLNEGPNYFGVTATDRAGNVASVVVWVYRDTFDPVLEVFSPSDGLDTNATDVRVLGRAEEYDTVTITLHRSFTDIVDRPIYPDDEGQFDVLADLEEGVNEIVVTARDRAGNHVTVRRTVTLDTTPPEMELISPGDNALLNVHQVTVVFTVSEDADQVYVNGKRVLGTGELDTVVMLGEGENPITLRAFDLLYNEITIDLTVIVDTVPPVLQVTEPVNASFKTNDPFVEVRGRASDGDLNGITVHVEGGPATVTTDGKFYYLLELDEDGTHVIEVVARDRAGNIARETFTVDLRTEAPLMTLVFDPAEERVDPGTMLHIQGAATGIPLTVTIVHDAAGDRREFTFLLINMSFEHYLDLVDGVNTITVRSEDAYGNWNVTAPHVVNVKEKEVQETPGNDTLYLIAAVLVAVALIVVAYVVLKRP